MLIWGMAGAGVCAWAVTAYGMIHPRACVFGRVLSRGPRHLPRVALTFDDGPDPEVTPAILDALGEAGVSASFFLIGSQAARCPALVRRIAAGLAQRLDREGFASIAEAVGSE